MDKIEELKYNEFIKENKNKFNSEQLFQIEKGINAGIDYSIYANPEFNYRQMDVIYSGLIKNIDVSIYAKPEFKWEQMVEIFL